MPQAEFDAQFASAYFKRYSQRTSALPRIMRAFQPSNSLTARLMMLVLLAVGCHTAIAEPLDVDATSSVPAPNTIQYLEDPDGTLTLAEVSSPAFDQRFRQHENGRPRFGRTHATYWLRLPIVRSIDRDRYLLIDYPIIGTAQLYAVPINTAQNSAQPAASIVERIRYRTPLFRLDLPRDQPVMLYLRAYNGKGLLELPIRFLSSEQLLQQSIIDYAFFASILVSLCVLAIYNGVLYLNQREPSLLALEMLIVSTLLLSYQDSNLLPWLAPLNNPDSYFYALPLILTMVSALYFWKYVNNGHDPLMDKLCRWIPAALIATLPFLGLIPSLERGLYLTTVVLSLLTLLLIVRSFPNLTPIARQNAVGALVFLIAIQPCIYHQAGLIGDDWETATYIFQAGLLVALTLLSLAEGARSRDLKLRAERITAINEAKDRFLATMSHELRTPMNAIIGYNQLLQKSIDGAAEQRYLTHQHSASKHMMTLIDEMLDMSRLQHGRLKLHTSAFDLPEVIQNISDLYLLETTEKGIELVIEMPARCDQRVVGDATRLKQVLINLVGNAIKFSEGGRVCLQLNCQANTDASALNVSFGVTDNGPGIPPEKQQQVFEPFTQLDTSDTRLHGGAGLGLTISQQIVALMGGVLKLSCGERGGCHFYFSLTFPIVPTEVATTLSSPPLQPSTPNLSAVRTLLVDDDSLNLLLGHTLIESLGIRNNQAHSAQEALTLLESNDFDLVLMDISMPEMNGYEATRIIREDLGKTQLPIIALTAHALDDVRERCFEAGMNDYLTKPFELETLAEVIRKWTAPDQSVRIPGSVR